MIEVHSRDYFSLKYDAAAQNRISSLNGKNYIRGTTEQQVTKKITKVQLLTGQEVELPFGPLITSNSMVDIPEEIKPYDLIFWQNFEQSYLQPIYYYQAMHSKNLSDVNGAKQGTKQFLLPALFEVVFTDLNLPINTIPEITLSYETQNFQFGSRIVGTFESQQLPNAFQQQGVQQGSLVTDDWCNIWLGAGLKETEDRDVKLTFDSYSDDLSDLRAQYAYKVNDYYAALGSRHDGTDYISQLTRGFSIDELENVVKTAASTESSSSWFKGNTLHLGIVTGTLLNRDTYRVQIQLPIYNASVGNIGANYAHIYEWLKSINVQINYPQMSWEGTDFKFQAEGVQDEFPYKFQNTRMANVEDKVGDKLWSEYYPKLILDKYKEGKHYVELKVRVGFMLQNDIHIDTPLQIYDLKNKVISRKGVPCTFRVKRIIKSFSNNAFYYTINCLED